MSLKGWHEMSDPKNYEKWDFARKNADGFYTNFIHMWINSYQNNKDEQVTINDMQKAFVNKKVFFETSMEEKVNDSPNGGNNEGTDKKYIDFFVNAGLTVPYTSLNYGISSERVKTLKTYKGNRECLAVFGPWNASGDILLPSEHNDKARKFILETDGMETDGPLGFWYQNVKKMQEGSYSLVKFTEKNKKTSAVMLAPYHGNIAGYNSIDDFMRVSKHCVFGHEDNDASPDIWALWPYHPEPGHPTFPESILNENGEMEPANTLTGVAYWLIKHLNVLPKVELQTNTLSNAEITKQNGVNVDISINKKQEGTIRFKISNATDPNIEISPVIHAD